MECLEYYRDYFTERNMMEGKYAHDVLNDMQQQVKNLNIPVVGSRISINDMRSKCDYHGAFTFVNDDGITICSHCNEPL